MKTRKITTGIFLILSILTAIAQTPQKIAINGIVKDSTIKSILLLKAGDDLRGDVLEVSVNNGTFKHELMVDYPEGYTLMLGKAKQSGGGRFMPFIMEPGNLEFSIFSEKDFDNNTIQGGALNEELKQVKVRLEKIFNTPQNKSLSDSISKMFRDRSYFSEAYNELMKNLKEVKTQNERLEIYEAQEELKKAGLHLSSKGKILHDKQQSIIKEKDAWMDNYIANNNSIVGYYFLLRNLLFDHEKKISYNDYLGYLKKYVSLFPNHSYNEKARNILNSYKLEKGGKYTDFTNPDLNGKSFTLSKEIKGQIAVIDLWATWCGPCIAKSKKMIPVYNKYKNKGFTVVSVAGELKSTDRLKRFWAKQPYPWLNLVELDNQNGIWDKYGVSNSGGGIFLVDTAGTVVAVNPSIDEIKDYLTKNIK